MYLFISELEKARK